MKEITTIKLSKKTVELLNKLKIHPRQAYEEVVLGLLKKARFDKNKKGNYSVSQLILLLIPAIIIISGLFFIGNGITGQVIFSEERNYTQKLNFELSNNFEYVWVLENPGKLKGIKLNGLIEKGTSARAYIEHENKKYLIFDSNSLVKDSSKITGLVVNENKEKGLETALNKTSNLTLPFNKTLPINNTLILNKTIINESIINKTIDRIINIKLEYGDNEFYDEDNDGIEAITGIVDVTVADTQFNWDVDEENLCTIWDTYSVEDKESTLVCFGDINCCNFLDLEPIRSSWDDPFHSAYGQYGASLDNIVSAQVVYADYSLSIDDPYSEIYYSEWDDLSVIYYEAFTRFENVCVETCILENFNESQYKLIFEVDNGFLDIDSIDYTIEKEINETLNESEILNESINISENLSITPINILELTLIKNISDITIVKNKNISIDLNNYFSNLDNNTIFTYNELSNITIVFENNVANIIPNKGFTGSGFTFIRATKDDESVVSNVFKISVTTENIKDCSDFIKTDDGQYYCADDEKFYSCQAFEDAGDLRRCKKAKYSRNTVDKSMCPFKHKDCNVTVDMDEGWGSRQSHEKSNYKLSTFKENFYCGNGHCEVPFYFKSKEDISGKLDFNVTSDTLLRNISIERVLEDGKKETAGNEVSMKKHDSYYYKAYFDYEPEWTSGKIKTTKPMKFNISASLDGVKILELDPIAFEAFNTDFETDLTPDKTLTMSITCNAGDILIIGVIIEESATFNVDYPSGTAAEQLATATTANILEVEMWNTSNCNGGSQDVSIPITSGGNNKDAIGMVARYSGADKIDDTAIQTNIIPDTATLIFTSVDVSIATKGDFVVDVVGYDDVGGDDIINVNGSNYNRTIQDGFDSGGIIGGMSDNESDASRTFTMSWNSGTASAWGQIGVPLIIIPIPDTTPPIVNVSINNTSPKINEIINITANITDLGGATLSTANITINFSTGTVYMNYTLSGTEIQISNDTTITDIRGHVLNISVYVTDTSNNVHLNSSLITIANTNASSKAWQL